MEAIREACKKRGAPHLRGCVIYTSAQVGRVGGQAEEVGVGVEGQACK